MTGKTLFIPNKTAPQAHQPEYGTDMRAIEIFNPINKIIAGSGVTLTPSDGSGPQVEISAASSGSSGCLFPVKAVSGFSGEVPDPPSGAATVDGYSVATGDRILLTVQGVGANNGVWLANTAGAWTHPTDWATGSTIVDGTLIPVAWTPGSTLFASLWLTQQDTVVDTTAAGFVAIAGASTFQPVLPFNGTGGSQDAYNLSITSFGRQVTRRTGAYSMDGFESIVVGNGAITLPSGGAAFTAYIIKDSGAGTASIVPNAGQTIDGSGASIALAAWAFREVQHYDGNSAHWITI